MAVEFKSKNRFSATVDVGYDHFKGTVVNQFKPDTVRGFGFIPVLGGVKLGVGDKLYAALRAGLSFGTDNFQKHFTLSPAIGILLPNRNNPKIDIGARWLGMPGVPSIPENTFLDKGGFSYMNFRVAVVF